MSAPTFAGQVALVTGASRGIGRAIALELAARGMKVVGTATTEEGAERITQALAQYAGCRGARLDVNDAGAGEALVDAIAKEHGALHALVNNAGITVSGPVELVALDDFRRQIDVNLLAQVAVTQAMLPALRAASGRLVFISSVGGRTALPFAVPYNCSKFAIEALGDALRIELRKFGIKVALIEPGSIDTPIWSTGEQDADRIFDGASPRIRELYGATVERYRQIVKDTAERGIPAEKVAAKIEHALEARRPRARYLIGIDAQVMARLKPFVPTPAFDWLIARAMAFPKPPDADS